MRSAVVGGYPTDSGLVSNPANGRLSIRDIRDKWASDDFRRSCIRRCQRSEDHCCRYRRSISLDIRCRYLYFVVRKLIILIEDRVNIRSATEAIVVRKKIINMSMSC